MRWRLEESRVSGKVVMDEIKCLIVSHDRARVEVSGDVIGFRISFKDSIVIEMLKAPVMLSLAANLLKI